MSAYESLLKQYRKIEALTGQLNQAKSSQEVDTALSKIDESLKEFLSIFRGTISGLENAEKKLNSQTSELKKREAVSVEKEKEAAFKRREQEQENKLELEKLEIQTAALERQVSFFEEQAKNNNQFEEVDKKLEVLNSKINKIGDFLLAPKKTSRPPVKEKELETRPEETQSPGSEF